MSRKSARPSNFGTNTPRRLNEFRQTDPSPYDLKSLKAEELRRAATENADVDGMNWTTESLSRNVSRVTMNVPTTVGWEQWFLLSSDRHHDNAHTDHALERRHLEQAVERGAGIIDAMQGKWDRRQDRCALREEYQGGDYLDALVREAANFYGTSAANWIVMGRGNHEQAIYKHHETDLVERTVEAIKTKSPETPLVAGGYGGWIVLPDADIVLTGHTHDAWMVPIARERISARGTISHDEQVHIRSSTYKDEYGDGHSGWHVETMKPPKPRGAWWLRFYFNDKETLAWQAIRAT